MSAINQNSLFGVLFTKGARGGGSAGGGGGRGQVGGREGAVTVLFTF